MILVVDNYDSFTYNLVQYLGQCGEQAVVYRNDQITLAGIEALRPDGLMLSPGPCTPKESGVCLNVLRSAMGGGGLSGVPLFGVCLGHQAIAEVAGATVSRAGQVRHGKASQVRHDGRGVFAGMPNPFSAIRYHSLSVLGATLPGELEVSATSEDDGEVMGLRHRSLPVEGVQFHPESVLTEQGMRIVENFVRWVRTGSFAGGC
jgi:anthranilate synthase/aminodeoxychorismate synthase-like glutamine amidotransferase